MERSRVASWRKRRACARRGGNPLRWTRSAPGRRSPNSRLRGETPCPEGACAGSPFGDRWLTWKAEVFDPARSLLEAAPWVFARGNHEDCKRGGGASSGCWTPTPPTDLPWRRERHLHRRHRRRSPGGDRHRPSPPTSLRPAGTTSSSGPGPAMRQSATTAGRRRSPRWRRSTAAASRGFERRSDRPLRRHPGPADRPPSARWASTAEPRQGDCRQRLRRRHRPLHPASVSPSSSPAEGDVGMAPAVASWRAEGDADGRVRRNLFSHAAGLWLAWAGALAAYVCARGDGTSPARPAREAAFSIRRRRARHAAAGGFRARRRECASTVG